VVTITRPSDLDLEAAGFGLRASHCGVKLVCIAYRNRHSTLQSATAVVA